MLTEDEANAVMVDIEAITEYAEGWAAMLNHLTRMHKLRDNEVGNEAAW